MKRITSRALYRENRTTGGSDPTSVITYTIYEVRNGHKREIVMEQIWDLEIRLNGRRVAYGDSAAPMLQKLTGLTPKQLGRAYGRVHPYVYDPMGTLAMYR